MIKGLLVLILISGAAAGFSSLFLKRKNYVNSADYLVFSIASGFGIIIGVTLLFAALKCINIYFFITVILIGNLLLFRNRLNFKLKRPGGKSKIFLIIITVFLFINFFYSLFPPTFYDSMMYHLAVPNYYILNGGIASWETNFNASLPLNGEMLFLFSLLSGTVFTPKLISFLSGILIIILITSWYKSDFSQKRNLFPALIFITVPQISFLMSSSKTDIIGMLFLILAVRSFFYYLNRGRAKTFLIQCGIFWGLAVGTKYIFAFYLLGFLLSILIFNEKGLKKRLSAAIKISVIVLICLAPWFGKNIILNGNPFYPYLNKYFGNTNWDQSQQENFSTIIKRGDKKNIGDYLKFPLKILTTPYSYGMTAVWGFMFIFLLPFSIFHGKRRGEQILFLTSLLGFIFLIPFAMVPRYFLSTLLLISIPMSAGVEKISEKFEFISRTIVILILTISLLNVILLVNLQEKFFHGVSYLSKKYSGKYDKKRMKYLYSLPYYAGVEYINNHLSDKDNVIFLGEDRTFYIKKKFLASSFNDRNILIDILKKTKSFASFKSELQLKGITHVFYFPFGLERMGKSSDIYFLSQALREKMENYFQKFSLLYHDPNYLLYKINK